MTTNSHIEPSESGDEEGRERGKDPHGLSHGAPLIYAAYRVAKQQRDRLLRREIYEDEFTALLLKMSPHSALRFHYVRRQLFKLVNPYGHEVNGSRFSNETIGWFRSAYPDDAYLTDGFCLLICVAAWRTLEHGHRSIMRGSRQITTSEVESKCASFGFYASEQHAICRLLRRRA